MLPLICLAIATTTTAALTYKGADISSLLIEEAAGQTYKTASSTTEPLETILKTSGINIIRQRLWNDPSDGTYDLTYNLELARRASAAGLQIYLDFHFSDTWADPSQQTTPSAWQEYGIEDLVEAVYNYTKSITAAFEAAEIPLELVSIGNEITAGILWPLGEIDSTNGTYNLARLLHAASAGIRGAGSVVSQPKILVHLDKGWDYDTQEWWYDTVLGQGAFTEDDYDVQAVSYYPFYDSGATLSRLGASLSGMARKYGKELMVVETDWPVSCSDPEYEFPSDTVDIPFSAAGQSTWLQDVAGEIEGAGGTGLFYWEPAWLDNAGLGSSCENNLMFDDSGMALSSLAVFADL